MTVATRTPAAIELDPDPSVWASLTADPRRDPRCVAFRRQLGLPTDQPIILAGHQGQLWHPGIAAKGYAAQTLADRVGGVAAWLVVDTDDNDPYEIALPCRGEDGALETRTVSLARPGGAGRRAMGRPLPLKTPDEIGAEAASDELRDRLASAIASLDAWSAEDCAASQVSLAALSMLPEIPTFRIVRASRLAETDAFGELAEACAVDAVRESYNTAVEARLGSGVRRLGMPSGSPEIPFWLSGGNMWRPATVNDLGGALMPRALTLTGLVRAFMCDLFIHGTGGRAYEPINDRWLPGVVGASLAPFVTASATLRLRFDGGDPVSQRSADRAAWLAHHARHHPQRVGDDRLERERDRLLDAVRAAPFRSRERAEAYRELHRLLDRHRVEHAGALAGLDRAAAEASRRLDERGVREDRTYPAVLHDPSDLDGLGRLIRDQFDGAAP